MSSIIKSNNWKQDDFCNNTLHMSINKQQGTTCLLSQLLSKVTVTSYRSSAGILHGCLQQDGAPPHTAKNTPRTCGVRTSRSSSLTCGPQTARTWIQSIALFGVPFNRWFFSVDDSRQATSWSRQSSLSGANCCSVLLIAPLVIGVAGLSGSSRSKANKLNIWCKNCSMCVTLDNNWDNKHVVPCWSFL